MMIWVCCACAWRKFNRALSKLDADQAMRLKNIIGLIIKPGTKAKGEKDDEKPKGNDDDIPMCDQGAEAFCWPSSGSEERHESLSRRLNLPMLLACFSRHVYTAWRGAPGGSGADLF